MIMKRVEYIKITLQDKESKGSICSGKIKESDGLNNLS